MNYTREESEEMAKKYAQTQWPEEKFNEPVTYTVEDYIAGRMSLADKCKELEADNERMREVLEGNLQILEQTKNYRCANGLTGGNIFLDSAILATKQAINPTKP